MGVPDVEQAKRRLQDILRKAQKLEIPAQEVISTRSAQKLLARTRNVPAWMIWIAVFVLLLSGVVYARWPTRQEVETIRTVLRRTDPSDSEIRGIGYKAIGQEMCQTFGLSVVTATALALEYRGYKCSGAASGEFSDRVAALLQSSSSQDDC